MVYQGTVIKGVVVPDTTEGLSDGTRVTITPVDRTTTLAPETGFHPVGNWDGPPGELDRLLAEVQQLRDADAAMETEKMNERLPS